MYTCIIVDDLKEAVKVINDHVSNVSKLSVLLATTDSIAAMAFLNNNKPDIIFLDIEMPGLNGIEIMKNVKAKWGNSSPRIVFTTGRLGTIPGYENEEFDYLYKPVTFRRFKQCTDHIIDELDTRKTAS